MNLQYKKRGKNVREFVDLMKEILLLKPEQEGDIGLSRLRRSNFRAVKSPRKKVKKEVSLSELMRRH